MARAVGQKVSFQLANDTTLHTTLVYLVGKEISPQRTVRIHCYLNEEDKACCLVCLLPANIEIMLVEEDVVPTGSIANVEGKDYIFVSSSGNQFKAIRVPIGNSTGEFTEVQLLKKIATGTPVVTRGAFELMGLLKNKQS